MISQAHMLRRLCSSHGFSLVELIMLLVILSIVLAVMMQSMTVVVDDVRVTTTEREMEMLAKAIVGDPSATVDGIRSDFGYVGDIGALPPSLDYLTSNVGGYSTWNGPYIEDGFAAGGALEDEWGVSYSFDGLAITSTGSGTTMSHSVTSSPDNYLTNTYNGVVLDLMHNKPGADFLDSVDIEIVFPDGSGSTASRTLHPDALGAFSIDSLPVGVHLLNVIYTPELDTLRRYVTVLPRHPATADRFLFSQSYFDTGGSGPPPPTGPDTLILRPIANGSSTELEDENCSNHWDCVDEASADGESSYVKGDGNSWKTDLYELQNPGVSSGTIQSVTIWIHCEGSSSSQKLKTAIRTNGSTEEGSQHNAPGSWELISTSYSVNPQTGSAWTWSEINDLQGGVSIRREAKCTQVWVEVVYEP